ncbi:DUF4268 domain-containing protein [Mesorhizobium sp.]|uniref:DUF4268 domain-containing protein n=1 Tax=Mesorhizobium sp. TaxID=1871066 RepID=UPI0011FBB7DD|nr:DUF4268 domain-containing protein [Mesorhizobium sp.]TIL67579.1 MAG: DUF4268 domain-containing protein [Mesorhizobium sp.]
MNNDIGRLERVSLREVWKHEAYNFTQWLQNNIDILNEALGLSLVNVEKEQAAGSFSIDLVAEEEGGGTIIIENQLEKSNHDHLGKLITYLTAMEARAAIWIVSEPRPEHVAAIAWLNSSSSADFYLVKVEAVRIGVSPAAPLFTVIVGPSEEGKEISRTKQGIAERHSIRHQWWKKLVELPEAKLHSHITPSQVSWIGTTSGIRGLGYNYTLTQNSCTAELYIDRGKDSEQANETIFDRLFAQKEEIESRFGSPLVWDRMEGSRACRIRAIIDGGYASEESKWEEIQRAQANAMSRLAAALKPPLTQLKLEA